MPKIRRKSIENDFLLIFFLHAERGCRSIIYFNDFATPSFYKGNQMRNLFAEIKCEAAGIRDMAGKCSEVFS